MSTRSRASLGLPAQPSQGHDLASVPPDLDQTFSAVRQAQADLIQVGSQLGVLASLTETPRRVLEKFEKQAPGGDLDRLFAELASRAPAVKQAEARLHQAERRPGASRAEPPLLRHPERDRRRGDRPERQPRQ